MKCLICKKEFINLSIHVKRKHNINSDQYRKRFNLIGEKLIPDYCRLNLPAKNKDLSTEELIFLYRGKFIYRDEPDKILADKKRSDYLRKRKQEQQHEMGREALSDRRSEADDRKKEGDAMV